MKEFAAVVFALAFLVTLSAIPEDMRQEYLIPLVALVGLVCGGGMVVACRRDPSDNK